MKKLLVILLIALATCAAIEESFDDDVVLEKSLIKKGKDKLKDTVKKGKDKLKDTINKEKDKIKDKIKHETDKVKEVVTHPGRVIKKTVKNLIHVSNIFCNEYTLTLAKKLTKLTGYEKVFFVNSGAEANETALKLKEVVKKGIAWLKQNHLWDPLVKKVKELGAKYGNEYCEKVLPAEICGPAVDFALNHLIKN